MHFNFFTDIFRRFLLNRRNVRTVKITQVGTSVREYRLKKLKDNLGKFKTSLSELWEVDVVIDASDVRSTFQFKIL